MFRRKLAVCKENSDNDSETESLKTSTVVWMTLVVFVLLNAARLFHFFIPGLLAWR